jgi:hypothetical protein
MEAYRQGLTPVAYDTKTIVPLLHMLDLATPCCGEQQVKPATTVSDTQHCNGQFGYDAQ